MAKVVVAAVLALAAPAAAQPGRTEPLDSEPVASEPVVSPLLYRTGNLRVSVACADYVPTPATGLAVTSDGTPVPALRTNGTAGTAYTDEGTPYSVWTDTDVGYLVAPGRHHVTIAAPGCAPAAIDVVAPFDHAELATGRLAISDGELATPTGAPDGFSFVLAARRGPASLGPSDHVIGGYTSSYRYDDARATGGVVGLGYEHRGFAMSFDTRFAVNSTSGTATQTAAIGPLDTRPHRFSGSSYAMALAMRFGARHSFDHVALAAGSGIGVESWFVSTKLDDMMITTADAPDTVDASWYVPAWASATVKTGCDWGVQALVEIDVHPTALDASGLALGAGLLYQPSAACSAPAKVEVAPI